MPRWGGHGEHTLFKRFYGLLPLGVDFCNFSRLLPGAGCAVLSPFMCHHRHDHLSVHIFTHIPGGFRIWMWMWIWLWRWTWMWMGQSHPCWLLWTLGFICRRLANEFWLFFAWEDDGDDGDDDDSLFHKWPTCRPAFVPLNYSLIARFMRTNPQLPWRQTPNRRGPQTRAAKIKLAKCIYLVNLQTRLQAALTITRLSRVSGTWRPQFIRLGLNLQLKLKLKLKLKSC